MFCHKCGHELITDAAYCNHCGTQVLAASTSIPPRTEKFEDAPSATIIPPPEGSYRPSPGYLTPDEASRRFGDDEAALGAPQVASTSQEQNAPKHIGPDENKPIRYGPVGWYLKALKSYAVFEGRATRSEFWYFWLFNSLLVPFVASLVIGMAVGLVEGLGGDSNYVSDAQSISQGVWSLYFLATLIPFIAVGVRRLHDTGRSGWWWFVGFIPFIGFLIQLFFFTEDSQPGENRFGPNPKVVASAAATR